MQITHNNHFVPQSYLRRWSVDDHNIWCYQLLVPNRSISEWKLRSIKGVAYQQNLYTSLSDGNESDEFERWIESHFETPAQSAFERVAHRETLTSSDWDSLILYTAAQSVRTPSSYITSHNRWNAQLPDLMQKTLERAKKELEKAKRQGKKFTYEPLEEKYLMWIVLISK